MYIEESLKKFNDDKFNVIFRTNTMKKYVEKKQPYEKCYSTPFFWGYIAADGKVFGCSAYLSNDRFCYGNIYENSFSEIWESEKRKQSFEFVKNELNIKDCRVNCRMEEVVAIGYAKVKRKDLTGAISSVGGKELANVPVTTAMQALQGKAAGVNIVTESGAPGAGANITIRGGMSLTQSTEPLYIVDGFEMGSALDNIDINDIESIDVLKDASSTAIYGARGSNGIILITTKSGKKGKTQVSYNTYFSFDKLAKKLDLMSNVEDFVNNILFRLIGDL
jgi:radical SAM protein with 4Fe4S-binding SPASM domain